MYCRKIECKCPSILLILQMQVGQWLQIRHVALEVAKLLAKRVPGCSADLWMNVGIATIALAPAIRAV